MSSLWALLLYQCLSGGGFTYFPRGMLKIPFRSRERATWSLTEDKMIWFIVTIGNDGLAVIINFISYNS